MILYFLLSIIGIILVLLCVAVIHTLLIPNKTSTYKSPEVDDRAIEYADKLSKMIQCKTVSHIGQTDLSEFDKMHKVFEEIFPNIHKHCQKIDLDGNLLYKWSGKSSENPILLMSHQDVVEVSGAWEHDPFGGEIIDNRVWGRGSCDTKCSLMALMQACEELISEGYEPNCDVYIASSRTEEIGGNGAPTIVNYLKEHNVHLFMVCDEGGAVTADPIPGVKGYFAMVGVYEKGNASVSFTANSKGGHASAPPRNTPIARLADFIHEIEHNDPFDVKFSKEVREMFRRLAPYCGFPLKLVFGNLWLFEPLLKKLLPTISPQAAAMLKTTIAFTMAQGSDMHNVIPSKATITANMRFIPHQKKDASIELLKNIAKKSNIDVEVNLASDPSPSLDVNSRQFKITEQAINTIFKGSACIPYVMTGATDARFYHEVSDACIRFAPIMYDPQQLSSMHGLNENVFIHALPPAVDYYKYIIKEQ